MVKVREIIAQNKMLPVGMALLVLSFILSMITVIPQPLNISEEKVLQGSQVLRYTVSLPQYSAQNAYLYVNFSAERGNGRMILSIVLVNSTTPTVYDTINYYSGYSDSWRFESEQLSGISDIILTLVPSNYTIAKVSYYITGYFFTHDYLLWISIPSFIVGLGAFFVGLFRAVVALAKRERERRLRRLIP